MPISVNNLSILGDALNMNSVKSTVIVYQMVFLNYIFKVHPKIHSRPINDMIIVSYDMSLLDIIKKFIKMWPLATKSLVFAILNEDICRKCQAIATR